MAAREQLARLRLIAPERWEVAFRQGHIHIQFGEWEAAAGAFSQAISLRTNAAVSWLGQALAKSCVGAADESYACIQTAIRLASHFQMPLTRTNGFTGPDPSTFDQWEQLGADCLMFLRTNWHNPTALCVYGMVLGTQTQWLQARTNFTEVANLWSNKAMPCVLRAWAHRSLNDRPESNIWVGVGEIASQSITLEPDEPLGWLLRGDAQQRLDRHEAALTNYLRALDLGEESPALRLAIARLQIKLERWPEALANLRRNLVDNPDDMEAARALACILCNGPSEHQDLSNALQLARRLAERAPAGAEGRQVCGLALYRAGKFDEAVRELATSAFIQGPSTNATTACLLALCHSRLGHESQARVYYSLVAPMRENLGQFPGSEVLFVEAETLLGTVTSSIGIRAVKAR